MNLKRLVSKTGLLTVIVLAFFLLIPQSGASRSEPAQHFQTEQQAQRHCPHDTVVWVNTKTGVYHFKGQRWYGRTKEGCYECRKEADAEGDRPTHNGQ